MNRQSIRQFSSLNPSLPLSNFLKRIESVAGVDIRSRLIRAKSRTSLAWNHTVSAIAGNYNAVQQVGRSWSFDPAPKDSVGDFQQTDREPGSPPGGDQDLHSWKQRFQKPSPLVVVLIISLLSGLYFFGIGRNRYQVTSSFIVRLPQIAPTSTATLLGSTLAGPTMLGSLEDGRFLAVYLTSPEVMKRVFLALKPFDTYKKQGLDLYAGLDRNANFDQRLAFFRRQVYVAPQDLTGVINMTTTGMDPATSYRFNQLLLQEAEDFLNKSNQSISQNQQAFAEQEVLNARKRLEDANAKLSSFKNTSGRVNVSQEAVANTSYISQLESQLVALKVQEAALKRQFRDHTTPEVAYVTDQVNEMENQIEREKAALVSAEGENYNQQVAKEKSLENEVAFATDALNVVMAFANDRRRETQQQIKFLVRLSDPEVPEMQSYDWRFRGFLAVVGVLLAIWGATSFTLGVANRK